MDSEYPGQTGVFEKEADEGFPGWLPPERYVQLHPPFGSTTTLRAAELDPAGATDAQAVKAYLNFGGDSVYYLISVRRRELGDELHLQQPSPPPPPPTDCDEIATPHGIPDCGVLIERVVEGGDPAVSDCDGGFCTSRWVRVLGNANPNRLWHDGDIYSSATYVDPSVTTSSVANDGISISVHKGGDSDHYSVKVSYAGDLTARPDVGIYDWLRPPSNTYETTDIWVDSPINGYGVYRYGLQSDLHGGKVPIGNGDDPAVGQRNRIYARVRNFGTAAATNVTVRFAVSDPPGLGISGPAGFKEIGTATVASIPPGGTADVFFVWTPQMALTADELAAGKFTFHSGFRVSIDHLAHETFFANQDGDGEEESVGYLDAASSVTPGAPGAASQTVIHLLNDTASTRTYVLGVMRDDLPPRWTVDLGRDGTAAPVVTLPPGGSQDVPIAVTQNADEHVGTRYHLRVIASTQLTLTSPHEQPHTEVHTVGGVALEVAVVRRPKLSCRTTRSAIYGSITGLDPTDRGATVSLALAGVQGQQVRLGPVEGKPAQVGSDGQFSFPALPSGRRAVCLFAGSRMSTSAAALVTAN
jgi:hypothetical protein